jgi:hypothetical protein
VNSGLHEYLDDLQDRMNLVGTGIFETFFATRVLGPGKQMATQRAQ